MGKLSRMALTTVFSTSLVVLFANVASATHATLKVVNSSSSPILKFYAAPYWDKTYPPDRLGNYIIYPGQYWSVDLSDGKTNNCLYDVKVMLKNGQIFEDRIDVCDRTLTIYDK
jgi:peptidoglycan/xylan/chitin deacetylase (PgdA/CDA1 family)